MPRKPFINAQHEAFCREYLLDGNISAAAVRAGYNAKNTRQIGQFLLSKPEIQAYIKGLQMELRERSLLTVEKALTQLARIAYSDIGDYLTEGNEVLDISKLQPHQRAGISRFDVEKTTKEKTTRVIVSIRMHDQVTALVQLVKLLTVLNQKIEPKSKGIVPFIIQPVMRLPQPSSP